MSNIRNSRAKTDCRWPRGLKKWRIGERTSEQYAVRKSQSAGLECDANPRRTNPSRTSHAPLGCGDNRNKRYKRTAASSPGCSKSESSTACHPSHLSRLTRRPVAPGGPLCTSRRLAPRPKMAPDIFSCPRPPIKSADIKGVKLVAWVQKPRLQAWENGDFWPSKKRHSQPFLPCPFWAAASLGPGAEKRDWGQMETLSPRTCSVGPPKCRKALSSPSASHPARREPLGS